LIHPLDGYAEPVVDDGPDGLDGAISEAGPDVTGPPDVSGPGCPDGRGPAMVRVDFASGSYCVDATEVSRVQYAAFLAAGPANAHPRCAFNDEFLPESGWPLTATTGSHPVVGIDWCDAHAFCAWAGKTLCGAVGGGPVPVDDVRTTSVSLLVHACSRGAAYTYCYGNVYEPKRCNTAPYEAGTTVAVGSMPTCQGGYDGIFDLGGNVSEWVDSCVEADGGGATDSCRTYGSSYIEGQEYDLRCRTARERLRDDPESLVGFRCCAIPR